MIELSSVTKRYGATIADEGDRTMPTETEPSTTPAAGLVRPHRVAGPSSSPPTHRPPVPLDHVEQTGMGNAAAHHDRPPPPGKSEASSSATSTTELTSSRSP